MEEKTKSLILTTIFPLCGTILSNIFYLVTGKEILKSRATGVLTINPLPLPFATACTIIWVSYGVQLANLWVIAGNFVPMLYNIFASLVAYSLAEQKMRKILEMAAVSLGVILGGTGILMTFAKSDEQATSLWGLMGDIITVALLLAPVATVKSIIEKKDASIIYLPLGFATLVNSFFWASYGLALGPDWYITLPNFVGISMATLQIILKLRYGGRRQPAPDNFDVERQANATESESESARLVEITPLPRPEPIAPPAPLPLAPAKNRYISPSAPYKCARPPTYAHPFFRVYFEKGRVDASRIVRRLDLLCSKIRSSEVRARLARNRPLYYIVRDPSDYIEFAPLASCMSFDGRSFLEGASDAGMVAFADNPPAGIPGFFSTRLITCEHGYREEDIVVHEFLHSIHQSGLTDAQFDRLEALFKQYNVYCKDYQTKDCYAFTSSAEFFAEMGQIYLSCTARVDVTGGITRRVLREKLPDMFEFLCEVFEQDDTLYKSGCFCESCFYCRPLPE